MYVWNNQHEITLQSRLNELIPKIQEFKILVGYFYFSGLDAIYEGLNKNQDINLKVLVGLDVDRGSYELYEYGLEGNLSHEDRFKAFLNSLKSVFNSKEFDTKEFEEKAKFF
ncbi:hypothetical protein, partial [Calditerrivibrio sp.]|uniref:hypothetical protein n=1 Tax=Calditerrivibrio sp. TaxID=2792612 RepID=UPI003D13799C